MQGRAESYDELRAYGEGLPIIDCHDHASECGPKYDDVICMVLGHYFRSDILSASSDQEVATLEDRSLSLEERWPILERAWRRTCHTGYARVTRLVLSEFYGEHEFTLEALQRVQSRLIDLTDPATYESFLEKAHIVARLANIWPNARDVVNGSLKLPPRSRLVIGLPQYHRLQNWESVRVAMEPLGRYVTSLDEYLAGCREMFETYKAFGAVAFKDQSAYNRAIDYGNPTRAEAEAVFNWFMEDPRRQASYPDGIKPLDDFLFHEFMRMARDMDLPVQIHTGHMAGIRNDIAKTNAVGLTKVLELHRDVRFDIFHANWPYAGELLYLCKNYPNVSIDFCWANIIDPYYCQGMFKQALTSVPHGKVHGYGSDFRGFPDRAWAHAQIARDNIAIALSDMVDLEYIGVDDAKEIAHNWLFDNPNQFFRLGL